MLLPVWTSLRLPVIGMLHCPPLPGAPRFAGELKTVREAVLRDAEVLAAGGVDALMLENFGDTPFYPGRVPAETVAALTAVAVEVRQRFELPLGINVLRNDGCSALAIAAAVGAEFIRVNVLCGARLTDQGIIQGIAHDLLRDRSRLKADSIKVLADVNVKHSAALAERSLADEVHDLVERGGADAVIVTGAATGSPVDATTLRTVKNASGSLPVLLGSGVAVDSPDEFFALADGLIVGTSLKQDGRTTAPIDPHRVQVFMDRIRRARGSEGS